MGEELECYLEIQRLEEKKRILRRNHPMAYGQMDAIDDAIIATDSVYNGGRRKKIMVEGCQRKNDICRDAGYPCTKCCHGWYENGQKR